MEEADETTIWMAKKYIDKPPAPYYIPTIKNTTSNNHKAFEFTKIFLPHRRAQRSTTSTTQSTPNQYHANKPSPLIKPTMQSAKHHQRRLQDQTKSPTKSSKNHTTLYSTIWILHALVQASINTARVGNRSDRVGFPPWTDPTEAISVLEIFQTDPGIFRSGLSQV